MSTLSPGIPLQLGYRKIVWACQGKNVVIDRGPFTWQDKGKLFFTSLNEDGLAIGNFYSGTSCQPVYWQAEGKLHFLTDAKEQNLSGEIAHINKLGQMVGFLKQPAEQPPAVWSQQEGLKTLRNFRSQISATAKAQLADIAIADDGTVYGTYTIKDSRTPDSQAFYTYAWLPYDTGDFKLLDLDNMRMAALNESHVLVGQFEGQAAVCEPGERPLQLCKAIKPAELQGWQLLEATSINRYGDIVGYGLYKGKMHLFKAERIRPLQ